MTLPVRQDLYEVMKGQLLYQWAESPNIQGLIKSVAEVFQPVEDALIQLLDERGVKVAVGAQLDVLGSLVNEPRLGRSDPRYRLAILNRAVINRSNGTVNELISFLSGLTGSENVKLWEHFSGNVHVYADQNVNSFVAKAINDAASAGISVNTLFDVGGESLVPSEANLGSNILVTGAGDTIQVVDNTSTVYDFAVSSPDIEVTDFSFLTEIYERKEGTQSIVDPELDDSGSWTQGTGWSVASGVASKTAGVASSLSQAQAGLVVGRKYIIQYTISNYSAGTVTLKLTGGTTTNGTARSANGFYDEVLIPQSGNNTFELEADSSFAGDIDNISIFELNEDPINPPCEVLDGSEPVLEISTLVNDNGDFLVDEFNNNFIVV